MVLHGQSEVDAVNTGLRLTPQVIIVLAFSHTFVIELVKRDRALHQISEDLYNTLVKSVCKLHVLFYSAFVLT